MGKHRKKRVPALTQKLLGMSECREKANVLEQNKEGNTEAPGLEKSPETGLYRVMVKMLDVAVSMAD